MINYNRILSRLFCIKVKILIHIFINTNTHLYVYTFVLIIYRQTLIFYLLETEKALEAKINNTRPRLRPMDLYLSASESNTGCKVLKEIIICICNLHISKILNINYYIFLNIFKFNLDIKYMYLSVSYK